MFFLVFCFGVVHSKTRLQRHVLIMGIKVFRAMQAAYVRLLQNPFYDPDEHSPPTGRGGKRITSRRFAEDMRKTGESWVPGLTTL